MLTVEFCCVEVGERPVDVVSHLVLAVVDEKNEFGDEVGGEGDDQAVDDH